MGYLSGWPWLLVVQHCFTPNLGWTNPWFLCKKKTENVFVNYIQPLNIYIFNIPRLTGAFYVGWLGWLGVAGMIISEPMDHPRKFPAFSTSKSCKLTHVYKHGLFFGVIIHLWKKNLGGKLSTQDFSTFKNAHRWSINPSSIEGHRVQHGLEGPDDLPEGCRESPKHTACQRNQATYNAELYTYISY